MRQFTNTEIQTWKNDRRLWWLKYHRRLKPVRVNPVSVSALGTLVHAGLDVHYSKSGDPLHEIRQRILLDGIAVNDCAEFSEEQKATKCADVEKQGELAVIMVEGYLEWLEETGEDVGLTVVGSEQRLEVPLGSFDPQLEGVSMLAKLDVRFHRDLDDAILFMDHKTVAEFTTKTKLAYSDEQFLHYHLMDRLSGLLGLSDAPRADGAILNMLRKVKRTARSKPPFYAREFVRHNDEYLRSYWMRLMEVIREIRTAEARLAAGDDHRAVCYPNPTRDTATWRGKEFWPIYTMFDDGSDVESVIHFSYEHGDPWAYYGTDEEPDD